MMNAEPRPGGLPDARLDAIRRYRAARLRAVMRRRNVPLILAYDPVNVRYITDARNMQVYALNQDCRYVFIAADGPTVLFEWNNTVDFFKNLPGIDKTRCALTWGFLAEGDGVSGTGNAGVLDRWADEIADLVKAHSPDDPRLGVDRMGFRGVAALSEQGVTVVDGQGALYEARAVKSPEEIEAIRIAIAACEDGFQRMREAPAVGMTEVELWALLHQANIEWEGEWINARLLSSGPRTNPWMQEAGLRRIEKGDVIAVDSDLVGPYGYAADISRTWIADGAPTDRQRRIYATAHDHIARNIELFRAGRSFKEIESANVRIPEAFTDQMFSSFAHGLGLCNEWPIIMTAQKADTPGGYGGGYDGVLEPGMTMCIESYIGEVGGPDGVKLEQQILITDGAPEVLSTFPFEESWL
jgi:Xaa-Pro dipeptidase